MKFLKKFSTAFCAWLVAFALGGAFASCTLDLSEKNLSQAFCNHSYEWVTVAPTCNAEGFTVQICVKCDYVFETSKKDKKPATEHTGIGVCPICELDYFAEFTAYLDRTLTNYDGSGKRYTDDEKYTEQETEYYLILRYYPETAVVETTLSLYSEAVAGNVSTSLTLKMTDAGGEYEFLYVKDGWEVAAKLHALGLTATDADWTAISSSYRGAPAEADAELMDGAIAWLRVAVKILNERYFPPYEFAFDLARFGFANVLE